jgi:hypothetical protein
MGLGYVRFVLRLWQIPIFGLGIPSPFCPPETLNTLLPNKLIDLIEGRSREQDPSRGKLRLLSQYLRIPFASKGIALGHFFP